MQVEAVIEAVQADPRVALILVTVVQLPLATLVYYDARRFEEQRLQQYYIAIFAPTLGIVVFPIYLWERRRLTGGDTDAPD